MYSGFCPQGDKSRTGAKAVTLDKDMLTVITEPQAVVSGTCYSAGTEFEGHAFFEASSIRKVNGKYYFIYSSEVMHELCYAVSDEPLGGFRYGGVLVSNTDLHIGTYKPADMPASRGANNHGSIIEINGEWYIFYHRHTNGTWFSRQGCAEKLTLNADGSFMQAEMTSCGLNGGPLEGRGEYPAYIACNIFGRKPELYIGDLNAPRIVQDGRDGDEETGYIYNIKDGTNIGFKYFDCKGITKVSITTRGYGNGSFAVKTAWDGEELGEIEIDNSNIWKKYTADIRIPDGVNAIWFTFKEKGSSDLCSLSLGSFILE